MLTKALPFKFYWCSVIRLLNALLYDVLCLHVVLFSSCSLQAYKYAEYLYNNYFTVLRWFCALNYTNPPTHFTRAPPSPSNVQPSSPPAAESSPVARAPLRPQRYFSAPKSSRPPFLLPSPPISSLVLPSSPQSLLSSKSPVLLCLILTLVLLLVSAQ